MEKSNLLLPGSLRSIHRYFHLKLDSKSLKVTHVILKNRKTEKGEKSYSSKIILPSSEKTKKNFIHGI